MNDPLMSPQELSDLRAKLWVYFKAPDSFGSSIASLLTDSQTGPPIGSIQGTASARRRLEVAACLLGWLAEDLYFRSFLSECIESKVGAVISYKRLSRCFEKWSSVRKIPYFPPKRLRYWLNEQQMQSASNRQWFNCTVLSPDRWKPAIPLTTLANSYSPRVNSFTPRDLAFITKIARSDRINFIKSATDISLLPSKEPDALKTAINKEELRQRVGNVTAGRIDDFGNLVVLEEVLIQGKSPVDAIMTSKTRGYDPSWNLLSDSDIRNLSDGLRNNGKATGDTFVLIHCYFYGGSVRQAISKVRGKGFKTHGWNWSGFKSHFTAIKKPQIREKQ